MRALRLPMKWPLRVLAWLLGTLAVLLLVLRLLLSQVGGLTPTLEALLASRIGADVTIEHLSVTLERNDLFLRVEGVHATTFQGDKLISLKQAHLRLDSWASLFNAAPIFNDARIVGLELHFYQQQDAAWGWPRPAELPDLVASEPSLDLAKLDRWAGLILRQRLWVENTRFVLHGKHDHVAMHAPTLLLNGDERRTQLEGAVNMLAVPSVDEEPTLPALNLHAEMQPGQSGFRDFSAALQLDMQLDHLVSLAEVLRPDYMPHLEQAGGDVTLWGRWQGGRLAEARLAVDIPELVFSHNLHYAVLNNIQASGLWQREGDGGQAWLSGNADSVEWAKPEGVSDGPALPRHWYLSHQPGHWELRTSDFELSSLNAWREYVLLPESVTRVLQTLSPTGQVQGLQVGQQEGRWRVDAALTNVAVLPWNQAPGGGPLDAWVQARDLRGRVTFNSAGDSTLFFPSLFMAPMQLSHAKGVVEWVYDGPNTMISGRDLSVRWAGADVRGGFGLVQGNQRGHFGLDIDFNHVDALSYPLSQWLPMYAFAPELRDWLLDDIGGYVPSGSLQLHLPLADHQTADELSIALALSVTQGHMPMAPGWPRLEDIEGQLVWQNQVLNATIDHAQSHDVEASEGELTWVDEVLSLSGRLTSDGQALIAFLQQMPVIDASLLNGLNAQGTVSGDVALQLPLSSPDRLQLEVNAQPQLSRLVYQPLGIPLADVEGEVTWQQQGDHYALIGEVHGQFLGGAITAEMDGGANKVNLHGRVNTAELFRLIEVPHTPSEHEHWQPVIEGSAAWRGEVLLEPTPTLSLESRWLGVTSRLPAPFAKTAEQPWPWRLTADMASGQVEMQVAEWMHARGQSLNDGLTGELALGNASLPLAWPTQPGMNVLVDVPEIALGEWQTVLAPLRRQVSPASSEGGDMPLFPWPVALQVDTSCVRFRDECLGELSAVGDIRGQQIDVLLSGDLGSGRVEYRPHGSRPLDVMVTSLAIERLLATSPTKHSRHELSPRSWVDAVETRYLSPLPMPAWLAHLPDGRLRLAEIRIGERRLGPLTAYWQANGQQFSLSPVGLTLGQLTARGELFWEGNEASSQTQANISIVGGNIGTALERLGQPVAMRSRSTDIQATLAWPGAPWQLELSRGVGEIRADIRDGRFVTLASTPARLVGLLNVDNLLRRLRLDFSDVTGQGTAFDRVHGRAEVAGGRLILQEPLRIEAPAASIALSGNVKLIQRELDQRLSVTLPISQSLPIAAIAIGAPIVGGALLIADQLFGTALDRATTIHYRVRGPWTSPQVTLEGSQ